jgi:hypothetical protein
MIPEMQYVLLAFNAVFGIAGFFGGIIMKGMLSDVKNLQAANLEMVRQLGTFATRADVKADVSEVRNETREALSEIARAQAEGFNKVFDKIDELKSTVAQKADRSEVR